MWADQAWAMTRHRLGPMAHEEQYDGDPRFALVTVNRSTTRYLKLMLLTLAEQQEFGLVRRIVIVDNASRDRAGSFSQHSPTRSPGSPSSRTDTS